MILVGAMAVVVPVGEGERVKVGRTVSTLTAVPVLLRVVELPALSTTVPALMEIPRVPVPAMVGILMVTEVVPLPVTVMVPEVVPDPVLVT